ncbi:MAG: alkaline phosphatase PhoX, partial [Pseudomonadota bacterium]
EFDHETRGTAESQAASFGDNIDGMEVFAHGEKLLYVANNEYTNRSIIWGNRAEGKFETDDDVNKGKMAHGITVVEIALQDGQWGIVKDSSYNRRITPDTEMELTGPAAKGCQTTESKHAAHQATTADGRLDNPVEIRFFRPRIYLLVELIERKFVFGPILHRNYLTLQC